jgi:hypothetical protein
MAGRKSGLGRGLEALIPVDHPAAGYAVIQLESVVPNPQQPRVHFDASVRATTMFPGSPKPSSRMCSAKASRPWRRPRPTISSWQNIP